MATDKTARATWEGDLMSGSGRISTGSGALSAEGVTWSARAEEAEGVSPEELIAAAHALCVSMALSHALADGGNKPTRLETNATATFDKTEAGFRLTQIEARDRRRGRRHRRRGIPRGGRGREGELPGLEGARGQRRHLGRSQAG